MIAPRPKSTSYNVIYDMVIDICIVSYFWLILQRTLCGLLTFLFGISNGVSIADVGQTCSLGIRDY